MSRRENGSSHTFLPFSSPVDPAQNPLFSGTSGLLPLRNPKLNPKPPRVQDAVGQGGEGLAEPLSDDREVCAYASPSNCGKYCIRVSILRPPGWLPCGRALFVGDDRAAAKISWAIVPPH